MSAPLVRFVIAMQQAPRRCFLAALVVGLALVGVGCAPEIGDDCGSALDCSAQGSRLCDRTQPGGYCTIQGCEKGTCPDEAVCVKFRPSEERLAVTYCMFKCSDRGDCRDHYECTAASDFGSHGDAEILGRASQRFCSIPASMPAATSSAPSGADKNMSDESDASVQ
jgi:hypothetical protein